MSSLSEMLGGESTPYKLLGQKIMTEMRVSMPGIIDSFDAARQTATVKPAIDDSIIKDGKQEWVSLELIPDVPVVFPCGGNWVITLPVEKGDACMLIFADSCIDAFLQTGAESTQAEVRHHDMSDAIAIVGFSTMNAPVPGYSADKLEIRHKSKPVCVSLSDNALDLLCEESSISMSAGNIKISGGTVDINGTTF